MLISKRKYLLNGVIGLLIVGAILFIVALIISNGVESKYIEIGLYYLRVICVVIFVVIMSSFLICIIRCGGIKKYQRSKKIVNSIETNLISIGAYQKKKEIAYVILPRIKVKDNLIIIDLKDIKVRDRIVNSLGSFSTALPNDYIVEDYYINAANNRLILEYEDVLKYRQEEYEAEEYKRLVNRMDCNEFYIDRKHRINMVDYPHLLYSGGTGSGKSYAAMQIVAQAIIKDWDVTVLDIKRSYGVYRECIEFEVEPDEIVKKLQEIEKDMYRRLESLEKLLDDNPQALATDCGYTNKLVLIEEYISLQSALDKKNREELERVVKNLSVLARQACIHIMIVMQSAGTENINSSTRAQFTKMLLGNAQSNIIKATFGNGVDVPDTMIKKSKGEGLLQLDRITTVRIPKILNLESFSK